MDGVGAIQGEIISPVASPILVGHEEALVNSAIDLWPVDLTVGRLKLINDISWVQRWTCCSQGTLHVRGVSESAR